MIIGASVWRDIHIPGHPLLRIQDICNENISLALKGKVIKYECLKFVCQTFKILHSIQRRIDIGHFRCWGTKSNVNI